MRHSLGFIICLYLCNTIGGVEVMKKTAKDKEVDTKNLI